MVVHMLAVSGRLCILSLNGFANAKLFRLSYAVHRDYTIFRKAVPCRYIFDQDTKLFIYNGLLHLI